MTKSGRLRLSDLRSLHELHHECRALGDDPVVWRRRMSSGLARLVDAELVCSGELEGLRGGRPVDRGNVPWGFERGGFDIAGWLKALQYLGADPNYSLVMNSYAERFRREEGAVFTRNELIMDPAWYRSDEYQIIYRTIGGDNNVWCFRSIPGAGDEASGALLTRARGRPDFTARQKAVVRQFFADLGPLVGGPLARFREPGPSALAPRVRLVLRCVLEGDSDKQVAARLRISPHTVNQYVKAIYRHFGVTSRPELLARWIRRGWGATFAWAEG